MTSQHAKPVSTGAHPGFLEDALGECRRATGYITLFSLGANLLTLALPLYSLQVLDRVISSGSTATLLMLALVTSGLIIGLTLLQEARSLVMIRMSEWLEERLGSQLLALSISSAAVRGSSDGAQNLRDLNAIKTFLTGSGISSLCDAPWAPIYLLVIVIIHPLLGMIATIGAILLLAFALLNETVVRKSLSRANDMQVRAMARAESSIRNSQTVMAMGMMPAILRLWKHDNAGVVKMQSLASYRSSIIAMISRCLRMLLQIVTTACGAWLVLQNQISVGGIIASSILIGRALGPFETAIGTWKNVVDARKSLLRLRQNIERAPLRTEEIALPAPTGRMNVESITFAPPGVAKPTVRNVSFSLQPGEVIGIVGESAAGKSTLAKLLIGIWKPQNGIVRLDGADVYTWNREDFGKHTGYLPQEVELFEGTLRDNICRFREDASDEAVVAAAQAAGVHEMILGLPQGYRMHIGQAGLGLSAGQRQRIALARAFFGEPKLVVLDEPNANLDADGDRALLNAILRMKENGVACVLISHRPSILNCVDTLLVMSAGQVADYGPVAEVAPKYLKQPVPSSPAKTTALRPVASRSAPPAIRAYRPPSAAPQEDA